MPDPEGGSEQAKLTTTFALFHPLTLAAGLRLPEIDGLFLSSLTTTEPDPELPSASVAEDVLVTVVFEVTLSEAGVGPLATPEPLSVAVQVIETFALFQPAPFGDGDTAAVTTGPVLSRTYEADFGLCDCPVQEFWALKFGDAAAVTVLTPSPVPAVKLNVHVDFAVEDCWCAVCAPVMSTHLVSLEVLTVSVSAPPFFA